VNGHATPAVVLTIGEVMLLGPEAALGSNTCDQTQSRKHLAMGMANVATSLEA